MRKINLNKTNLQIFSLIGLVNFIWFFLGLGEVGNRLMKIDQQIMLLTASRMHYLDLNVYEAAWNHHTPPIFYLFELVFLFSDYLNIQYGFQALYSFLLFFINCALYCIINKFINNIFLSMALSTCFVFDISSTTLGGEIFFDNRTIGIFFQCMILIFAFKLIQGGEEKKTILILSLFIFLQILFLESYIVSCSILIIHLLFQIKKKLKFFKLFLGSQIVFLIISAIILNLRSELINTINLNYIFHFDAVLFSQANSFDLNLLPNFGLFYHWNHNSISHLIVITIIFVFFIKRDFFIKDKEIQKYFLLIIIYFFGEVLHLFLTGPRFINYMQIILLFEYLIIFLTLYFCILKFNFNLLVINLSIITFLLIMFLGFQFGDVFYHRKSIYDKTYNNSIDYKVPDSEISKYLFNAGNPETLLAWVSYKSWDEIYFKSNKLPASRMWWWFEMKYVESYYDWKPERYYNTNLKETFIQDLDRENPKFAIIENGYTEPPEFFTAYIEENYIYINNIDEFYIFESKNSE